MSARNYFRNALLARAERLRAERYPETPDIAELPSGTEVTVNELAISHLLDIEAASRHLLETMSILSQSGPVFSIDEDVQGDVEILILRHAILNLRGLIFNSAVPAFALPNQKEIN